MTNVAVEELVKALNAIRAIITAYATGGIGPEEALEEIDEVLSA